ncbi:type VII secretion target [Gordonia metallireducens]|uniref:type VII secretion target n=1 Tax=Gordonia metallireducens TaxID=2897779 RepID=UPI001E5E940E|nr:type VII secretion target [Gordonia metallireducens]
MATAKVDPNELREASSNFKPVVAMQPVWPPASGAVGMAVSLAASGLDGLETSGALTETTKSLSSALATLAGRKAAWESILTTSADDYENTDLTAARRLEGLGDLNQPLPGNRR